MELKNGDVLMKVLGKWLQSADSPLLHCFRMRGLLVCSMVSGATRPVFAAVHNDISLAVTSGRTWGMSLTHKECLPGQTEVWADLASSMAHRHTAVTMCQVVFTSNRRVFSLEREMVTSLSMPDSRLQK